MYLICILEWLGDKRNKFQISAIAAKQRDNMIIDLKGCFEIWRFYLRMNTSDYQRLTDNKNGLFFFSFVWLTHFIWRSMSEAFCMTNSVLSLSYPCKRWTMLFDASPIFFLCDLFGPIYFIHHCSFYADSIRLYFIVSLSNLFKQPLVM